MDAAEAHGAGQLPCRHTIILTPVWGATYADGIVGLEASPARPPRLLDRVRAALRARHGSRRTEKAYVGWTRRYILFHGKRHPAEMGATEITQFLSALAVERHVAASRAGTPGPPGRQHDDDLHARPEPRSGRRPEPRRPHDRALTGPDYPGLCNTGPVGMKTRGKDALQKAILAKPLAPAARISLAGPAVYAVLSRSRY